MLDSPRELKRNGQVEFSDRTKQEAASEDANVGANKDDLAVEFGSDDAPDVLTLNLSKRDVLFPVCGAS